MTQEADGSQGGHSENRGLLIESLATVTRPLRRAARAGLRSVERRMHPARHRRAVEDLKSRGSTDSVLFICLGNICRSPYAEHSLGRKIAEKGGFSENRVPRIESAGFILPGRPSPEMATKVAAARGIDLGDHRSKTFTGETLKEFDLVIVMTAEQQKELRRDYALSSAVHLGDLDPGPVPSRDIDDPYGGGPGEFTTAFERIDRAVAVLHDVMVAR